jgi:seryl-tRNA synthetase
MDHPSGSVFIGRIVMADFTEKPPSRPFNAKMQKQSPFTLENLLKLAAAIAIAWTTLETKVDGIEDKIKQLDETGTKNLQSRSIELADKLGRIDERIGTIQNDISDIKFTIRRPNSRTIQRDQDEQDQETIKFYGRKTP